MSDDIREATNPEPLTPEQAARVLTILVDHAGFNGFAGDFIWRQTHAVCPEYRVQGSLGFGGKLYRDGDRLRVGCYREDETAERLAAIEKVNALLADALPVGGAS